MSIQWTRRKVVLMLVIAIAVPAATVGAYRVIRPSSSLGTRPALPPPDVVIESDNMTDQAPVFDLQPRSGEHPLAPAVRLAQQSLERIDNEVADYSCTFIKRERVNGKLQDQQTTQMKVRNQPLSVYLRFIEPQPGLECLYVEGANNGNMLVRAGDWRRPFGVVALDPAGTLATQDQRYTIRRVGIRRLVSELVTVAGEVMQAGADNCVVNIVSHTEVAGRDATMIEVTHPQERPEFRCYRTRIFIDNELVLPIRFVAWDWPSAAGEDPPLVEEYTYADLALNHGFTDETFSRQNPEIFQ